MAEPTPTLATLTENWEQNCNEDNYCQQIRSTLNDSPAKRLDIQLASCTLTPHSFSLNEREYVSNYGEFGSDQYRV